MTENIPLFNPKDFSFQIVVGMAEKNTRQLFLLNTTYDIFPKNYGIVLDLESCL